MSIDNYLFFNNKLSNNVIEKVINKINKSEKCELVLKDAPIIGSIVNSSKIYLNFDFKYNNNETAKVLITLFYREEENKVEDICENDFSKYKDEFSCDVFNRTLVISVVPKDDASYVLFQIFTKEILKEIEGIALCYLIFENDEEGIRLLSHNNITSEIDKNINIIVRDRYTIDNRNCVTEIKPEWKIFSHNSEIYTYNDANLKFKFKYSIIYLILSIIIFLIVILCCPTNYYTDAPIFYQKLADFSYILLILNIPVFILPIVIGIIGTKKKIR